MTERGAARSWVLAYVVMAGLGLGALILVGKFVGANRLPGEGQPRQTTTDGERLFLANCAACHGPQGEGDRAPSLVSGTLGDLPFDELVARISNGKRLGGMPKFEGVLSEEQIRAVAEHVFELRGEEPS